MSLADELVGMEGVAQLSKIAEDDVYSDVDSQEFADDMRGYGVGQALPLDVRACRSDSGSPLSRRSNALPPLPLNHLQPDTCCLLIVA
jgi:hypothetical protein